MPHLVINATCGPEHPERATLPFFIGNAALAAEQPVTVFLTVEGARLAVKGTADHLQARGHEPLAQLIGKFIENGGTIWCCAACTKPRGITDGDLIPGAKIVTATNLAELLAGGAATLSF